MREDEAIRRNLPFARIRGTIERHNAFADDPVQLRGGWAMDIDTLYAQAGCAPQDIDLLQTYDDYPVISMMQIEDLGFCEKGAGAEFVRAHDLTTEGDFPHNTSGGQLSVGQAGAAGGYLGMVEVIRQVTAQAGSQLLACGDRYSEEWRLLPGRLRRRPVLGARQHRKPVHDSGTVLCDVPAPAISLDVRCPVPPLRHRRTRSHTLR